MPPLHCWLDPPSPGAIPSSKGTAQGSAGNESPEPEPRQRGQPWPGSRGWHRVERGVGCQRRACQENVISLHKTCSSPAPLPQQQRQLKSFSPRLSQYCHIAASVEVLGPWKELRAWFKRWKGAEGAHLGGCGTPGLGIPPQWGPGSSQGTGGSELPGQPPIPTLRGSRSRWHRGWARAQGTARPAAQQGPAASVKPPKGSFAK